MILRIFYMMLLCIPLSILPQQHARSELRTAAINAGAAAGTGAVVAPALALANKVIGNQSWKQMAHAVRTGIVPFSATFAAGYVVQQWTANRILKQLKDTQLSSSALLAAQIPGAALGGWLSSIAEGQLMHASKQIPSNKRLTLMATGWHAGPAAALRDVFFFGGMQASEEIEKKLSQYSQNSSLNHIGAIGSSSIAATIVSNPAAYIRTRQAQESVHKRISWQEIIAQDGIKKLVTKGLGSRMLVFAGVYATMPALKAMLQKQIA